jgi:hypothetical protein
MKEKKGEERKKGGYFRGQKCNNVHFFIPVKSCPEVYN